MFCAERFIDPSAYFLTRIDPSHFGSATCA